MNNTLSREKIASQIFSVLQKSGAGEKDKAVLDIGCSEGIIANYLASKYKKVVGVDIDTPAVESAKRDYKKKNLQFLEMNGEKLTFLAQSFDIVVCNQVYMYFKNPEKLFQEIRRVLKPGGICFLGAVNKYSWTAITHPEYSYKLWWELQRLCVGFTVTSYSPYVVRSKYKALQWVPNGLVSFLAPLLPNFVWILQK
jgi:2-polyprenyl-3-methyl-5-hydroxy-6-metoxy-1,4-benzoquinol methylase